MRSVAAQAGTPQDLFAAFPNRNPEISGRLPRQFRQHPIAPAVAEFQAS